MDTRTLWILAAGAAASGVSSCGVGDDGPAAHGDRRGAESYVCAIHCIAGPAAQEAACLKGCVDAATASASASLSALLACRDRDCPGREALELCLGEKCQAQLDACLDDARTVENPCRHETPNSLGVGLPCVEQSVCTEQREGREEAIAAFNCPYYSQVVEAEREEANLPRWCTMLCEFDADCGEGAFCWQRRARDQVIVGSCALSACEVDGAGGGN